MTTAVFHAPDALSGARPGAVVSLTGDEARHAVTVRRLRVGERVDLVDGRGLRARGSVTSVEPRRLGVCVEDVVHEPAPAVRLVLVQALAKGGRDEQAVETATELGVDVVVPWQAERSVSRWEGAKLTRGRERWAAVATAAAKQSRRAWVPEVHEPVSGRGLHAAVASAVGAGGAVLVLHEGATTPLARAWLPTPGVLAAGGEPGHPRTPQVAVVVGPEGGITDDELALLTGAGGQAVRLGREVLRSSTAGPAALAVLAERLGRWT